MPSSLLHNEKQLLLEVSQGNERSFAIVFSHYFDHIYGFAFSVTKSVVIAEEIVQDVFVRVWNNRAQLGSIEKFDSWLFIIARNHAYRTIRQKMSDPFFVQQLEASFVLYNDATDEQLLLKESRELIDRAASMLPRQQQTIFIMSRIQGFSLDEIAGKLQLSKNTVKAHLTKALQGVRMYLQANAYSWILAYFFSRF